METTTTQRRVLIWSQVLYFVVFFPWLVMAVSATMLAPPHNAWGRTVVLVWLWSYPAIWLGSLFLRHRDNSRGRPRSAARWNLIPLAWILITALVPIINANT